MTAAASPVKAVELLKTTESNDSAEPHDTEEWGDEMVVPTVAVATSPGRFRVPEEVTARATVEAAETSGATSMVALGESAMRAPATAAVLVSVVPRATKRGMEEVSEVPTQADTPMKERETVARATGAADATPKTAASVTVASETATSTPTFETAATMTGLGTTSRTAATLGVPVMEPTVPADMPVTVSETTEGREVATPRAMPTPEVTATVVVAETTMVAVRTADAAGWGKLATASATDAAPELTAKGAAAVTSVAAIQAVSAADECVIADAELSADEIEQARLARRKARKAAKWLRVKALLVKRRRAERETDEVRRLAEEAVKKSRRRVAAEAVAELDAKRESRRPDEDGGRVRQAGAARVSLVKHQRGGDQVLRAAERPDVEYVGADDGLPTANMEVNGVQRLDSCARYTIAGTDWMAHGDKVDVSALVDYVEGIGGFLLDVVGVWRFKLRTVFNECIEWDACVVSGCSDEFLLGVDFMRARGATMDFDRNEVRYRDGQRAVVIPFRTHDDVGGARVAPVRMVCRTQLTGHAVTPVEVAVAAEDGERGLFLPTQYTGAVMLAATVTTARNGKAWVPAINTGSTTARLPNKKELGKLELKSLKHVY
ncbi:hypothetical protein PR003_g2155 [Phytophthora rubi]|uniref:Uncharacterized protein n=1 Tax=Phytophthora rubi TaxID=129364 RepID=A0A6A4G7U8_9STRA|nr:hypothetical protein PR001_g13252 [Phytophthora rubi]KAE9356742.1 hypothetical protein PR003_g2155 [Phytophthora rubi]